MEPQIHNLNVNEYRASYSLCAPLIKDATKYTVDKETKIIYKKQDLICNSVKMYILKTQRALH